EGRNPSILHSILSHRRVADQAMSQGPQPPGVVQQVPERGAMGVGRHIKTLNAARSGVLAPNPVYS
ncbi:MAG: hypothetical protein ACI9HE_002245, partial [Planctomycetota bacterium]